MKAVSAVWDGRISPVFDVSRGALVLTLEDGAELARGTEQIEKATAALKVECLVEPGAGTLIRGAISAPLHHELIARGVKVIAFVAGEIDEVMASFLASALPTPALSMPGCCGRRGRLRGGRGRGGWRGGGGWGRRGRQ